MTDPDALARPVSRRRVLIGLAAGMGSALLAACGVRPSPSATVSGPSPAPTLKPTATPSPSPAPTPAGPPLRAKIAQMLLVGFRGATPDEAAGTIAAVGELGLGGVLLFSRDQLTGDSRNIISPAQLRTLVDALRAPAPDSPARLPLLVAVDEEGGLVARLSPNNGFPATSSAAELGAQGDLSVTRGAGRQIGETLVSEGINLDLAPVVDVNVNPDNPIIGSLGRSFSADPVVVADQAGAFIRGLHAAGALSTLKHFPGHGSSTGDTHLGVVDVTDTWSRMELQPFAALIDDGLADAVLTAHVFNANLDPDYPATLSHATITGILRDQLGWDGVVLSDDMQMGAIRDAFGYADAVRLAINAGVDVLTIANQLVYEAGIVADTIDLVAGMVERGEISAERIEESWGRISRFKARLA